MHRPQLRLFLSASLVSIASLLAAGCDCAGPMLHGVGASCTSASDCSAGLICLNGVCALPGDGGPGLDAARDSAIDGAACAVSCRFGTICCHDGEECVDDLFCSPTCTGDRCGDNHLTCCGDQQICLDDVVCAANCVNGTTLCGANLDTCCAVGDVCVDHACVTPGTTCHDDFDCLTDGTYCEPTIGHCLTNPAPPLCEVRPSFDQVSLAVEWHWEGVTVNGKLYVNVASTPAVGDVSGDGIPDVVVAAYTGATLADAVLVALNGSDGTLIWSVSGADAPESISSAAVGNLDPSDDALEIVYKLASGPIRVLDGDGTTELARLATGSAATHRFAPSLADMDHDGDVEIAAGCHVMAFEPMGTGFTLRTIFDGGTCDEPTQHFASVAIANLDDDPELEVTSGGSAYDLTGTQFWTATGNPGLVAVADLDVDGRPDVITVLNGHVTVRDGRTGALHVGVGGDWLDLDVTIPGGGNGGAPTVADFDADGLPEISAAGQGMYAVYDPDCVPAANRRPGRAAGDCAPGTTNFLRWSAATQDISSSVTGSSVFDFQGDGVAEVVYNDECWLHVYDGSTGAEVLMMPRPNSSRTALEYPIVADVDRDGNSEIVVPANNDQAVTRDHCPPLYMARLGMTTLPPEFAAGTHGIYSFGDPNDRWVRTRPIWNQYAYHVTNVDDRGAIPMSEADNWSTMGLNDYRQNVQGAGVFNAPNLTATLDVVAQCGDSAMVLSAVITNAGSRGVPAGVLVELYQTVPAPEMLVGSAMTQHALLPGGSERVTVTVTGVPSAVDLTFEVRVDGATSSSPVTECNEMDNTADDTDRCNGLM